MRDIGTAGEKIFGGWCAAAGITVNESMTDAHGWDIFLEMDPHVGNHDPLSMHEGIIECKVQIKSTDTNKNYVDVEISNLRKMTTTLLPAFYVLIAFDKSEAPVRAYLRHVDEALITQVLKKISALKHKEPSVKLNKKMMRVNFRDEILPLTPSHLKTLIKSQIGETQSTYIEKKRKTLATAGFDQDPYKVQFTIPDQVQLERFIDASLGKKVEIDVREMHGSVTRFGHSTTIPKLAASSAVLSILDVLPDSSGRVRFREKATGRTHSFKADLYRGAVNSMLPMERRKIRIDAVFFEIMLHNTRVTGHTAKNSMTLTMTLDDDKRYEVEELLKAFNTFELLRSPVDIEFSLDFFNIPFSANLERPDYLEDCSYQALILTNLVKLKKHYEWSEPLMLSTNEIEPEIPNLRSHYASGFNTGDPVAITYEGENLPPPGLEVECFYVVGLRVGQYLFVELLVLDGTTEDSLENKTKVIGSIKESIYKRITDNPRDEQTLRIEIEETIRSYNSKLSTIDFSGVFFYKYLETPNGNKPEKLSQS